MNLTLFLKQKEGNEKEITKRREIVLTLSIIVFWSWENDWILQNMRWYLWWIWNIVITMNISSDHNSRNVIL